MAKMSKSFVFYIKNWDIMEYIADSSIDEINKIFEESNVPQAYEIDDTVRNTADKYCSQFLYKIRDRFIEKHIDLLKIDRHKVNNRKDSWERDFFIGKTSDDVSEKKWRLSFYIRKYKKKVCILSFVVRYVGNTMALKKEIDAILNTSIKNTDGEIYNDCTHLAFVELPTDWKKEIDDEPIIEEIIQKTIQALPENKLNKILSLD